LLHLITIHNSPCLPNPTPSHQFLTKTETQIITAQPFPNLQTEPIQKHHQIQKASATIPTLPSHPPQIKPQSITDLQRTNQMCTNRPNDARAPFKLLQASKIPKAQPEPKSPCRCLLLCSPEPPPSSLSQQQRRPRPRPSIVMPNSSCTREPAIDPAVQLCQEEKNEE
jgi:hypothetical protein